MKNSLRTLVLVLFLAPVAVMANALVTVEVTKNGACISESCIIVANNKPAQLEIMDSDGYGIKIDGNLIEDQVHATIGISHKTGHESEFSVETQVAVKIGESMVVECPVSGAAIAIKVDLVELEVGSIEVVN